MLVHATTLFIYESSIEHHLKHPIFQDAEKTKKKAPSPFEAEDFIVQFLMSNFYEDATVPARWLLLSTHMALCQDNFSLARSFRP